VSTRHGQRPLCRRSHRNRNRGQRLDQTRADRAGEGSADRLLLRLPDGQPAEGTNANLKIDAEERAIAVAQAAQFSQVCNVYAPMYPQLTKAAIAKPRAST